MDIQPTTITQIALTIQLTEHEARKILVDPADFQADLRRALAGRISANGNGRSRNGGKSISLGRKKNGGGKRTAHPKARAGAGVSGAVPCPKCGKPTKFLKMHARFCKGTAAGAE